MTKIIKKGNSVSYHKNWKEVAACYGWKYRNSKNAMKKHGEYLGYTVEDMQTNISIPVQTLLKWLVDKSIKKANDFNPEYEGTQDVSFDFGGLGAFDAEGIYSVVAEVEHTINMVEEVSSGGDVSPCTDNGETTIVEIIRVFDTEGELVPLNEEIKKLIIEKLEL